jgi:predicted porin
MKRLALTAVGCLWASISNAQSSVVVYGVFDTALRYTTNAAANGARKISVDGGLIQGSRVGFRGTEDIGGGLKASFMLESGFAPDAGTLGQQGQMWGRQAWVALQETSWGTLTAGRQFGVGFDTLGSFDPYGVGNHGAISWHADLVGVRFDNTVKYRNSIGPVSLSAAYSFGEQSGNARKGRTAGVAAGFAGSNYTLVAMAQQSVDVNEHKAVAWAAGGTAQLGTTKLFAGYVHNHRDQGFAVCGSNNASSLGSTPAACQLPNATANPNGINGPLSNTGLRAGPAGADAKTGLVVLGATWQAAGPVSLTAGFMGENNQVQTPATPEGRRRTFYGVADYYFSKRTDVYTSLDHDRRSGAYAGAYSGQDTQTGLMLGLRHRF